MSIVGLQAGIAARAEAQCRDGTAAGKRRLLRDRAVARHQSIETTQTYLHAHLALKEAALTKLKPYERGKRTRFRPNDRLLAFLGAL
jgi:hypothetical protein